MKKYILTLLSVLCISVGQSQIIINEVQADAGNNEGNGGEWIELKNISSSVVDLSCWRLSNGLSTISIPNTLTLMPNQYLLIGNASLMMCSACDYPSLNSVFTLNPEGFGYGSGAYSNTVFLNTDIGSNGGCNCLAGSGALNNGNGTGDRIVLFDATGTVVDGFMFAGGNTFGAGSIPVVFGGTQTCAPLTGVSIPATTDLLFNGRTICNDLGFCNSSYARIPDGNNGTAVTYSQTGNLACTNCLSSCTLTATNTASNDNPTPGLNNSAETWTAKLNSNTILTNDTTITICGATPITFEYEINNFANVALTANQTSGNLGSYSITNNAAPANFSIANFNSTTGKTTLSSTVTPPFGTTTYTFVWGDANTLCTACPGTNNAAVPGNAASNVKECYVQTKVTVVRENPLGGTPVASCSILGSIIINGATGSNLNYELQKQTTLGGPFTTISGPQVTNSFSGIIDDDADPLLPNYQVLVSSNNTVCINPTPIIVAVPNTCLGNPACATFATTGTGVPTFIPATLNTVCANSSVQFSVDINGVCTTGQVEVLYDFNSTFDPYTTGTSLGLFNTTVGATPPVITATSKVFINEFVPRPQQGTCAGSPNGLNPNSGEWIELYNPGPSNVDIGGWSLSDGDWTATIPAGTVILANSYFLIGGGGTFCSSGVMPDLNIETCNCATVSPSTQDIMNLTDGSEQITLYDCSGNFIDGVLWGGGQSLPDVTSNTAPATGCGDFIILKNLNLPAATSYTNSGGSLSGGANIGRYRTSSNTWTTTTTTLLNHTPKAQNPGGDWNGATITFGSQCPPPPVTSSFTVTLPDTCSQTSATNITLKAIYRPDPVAPCLKSDVTATATYTIPSCSYVTVTGDNELCEPNTAPITLTASPALVGNHDFTLSNGTNTASINGVNGVGPFVTTVSNSGVWTVSSVMPPAGTCGPHIEDNATIVIHPIPEVTAAPTNATFCYFYGFDLSTLNGQLTVSPVGGANTFFWYDQATGGSPISTYVNPLAPTTYYVAASTGSPSNCEGARFPVNLGITPIPDAPAISCLNGTVTLTPPTPNCLPTNCTGTEYSANGLNWSSASSFSSTDPGWAGFGSASNSTVYIRNASVNSCFNYVTYFNPCTYPLPTTITNFNAHLIDNNKAKINWESLQENNVSHYELEKSNDKISYNKIEEVKAIGNNLLKQNYAYTDPTLFNGENYYRLKIVDNDGQFVYSNVIVVSVKNNESQLISLYPNPANNFVQVSLNNAKEEKIKLVVLDVLGKKIIEAPYILKEGFQQISVPTEQLSTGIYELMIIGNRNTLKQKFQKM